MKKDSKFSCSDWSYRHHKIYVSWELPVTSHVYRELGLKTLLIILSLSSPFCKNARHLHKLYMKKDYPPSLTEHLSFSGSPVHLLTAQFLDTISSLCHLWHSPSNTWVMQSPQQHPSLSQQHQWHETAKSHFPRETLLTGQGSYRVTDCLLWCIQGQFTDFFLWCIQGQFTHFLLSCSQGCHLPSSSWSLAVLCGHCWGVCTELTDQATPNEGSLRKKTPKILIKEKQGDTTRSETLQGTTINSTRNYVQTSFQ